MFIGRYNDRPATLKVEHLIGEGAVATDESDAATRYKRNGRVYEVNDVKITVWDDGVVTAQKDRWRTGSSDPRRALPGLEVQEGELRIPLQDLAGIILERIPPDELARDLLSVEEVRTEMLEQLSRRWHSDYVSEEDRRKFLAGIKEAIHSQQIDRLETKLNELEQAGRTAASHQRWKKAESNIYKSLYEYTEQLIRGDNVEYHNDPRYKHFVQCNLAPEALNRDLAELQDPIDLESVGPQWHESRAYWRTKLEEHFPDPKPKEQVISGDSNVTPDTSAGPDVSATTDDLPF
ncbi:MAG: hypothetical protein JWN75_1215 [Candidatus Saccharibacteria bacterium]|nr:hypothetical protein [Candidatus Saccharibacteria bacterium]MDB5716412.1 hypothetical protein [Sphingomonadales bacterium]